MRSGSQRPSRRRQSANTGTSEQSGEPERSSNRQIVSVVIVSPQADDELTATLPSPSADDGADFEIIVVGSAPPGDTIVSQSPTTRWVQQFGGSHIAALNRGLLESAGDYLLFLSPGDRLLSNGFARSLAVLNADPTALAVIGWADAPESTLQSGEDRGSYLYLLEGNDLPRLSAVLLRASAFDSVGLFDETFAGAELYELCLRIARESGLRSHDEPVVERAPHAASDRDVLAQVRAQYAALEAQWDAVHGDPDLDRGWRQGLAHLARVVGAEQERRTASPALKPISSSSEGLGVVTAPVATLDPMVLAQRDMLQAATYDLRLEVAAIRAAQDAAALTYPRLVRQIREVVRETVPQGARIAVISHGDDELVDLFSRPAWHFPRGRDGGFAGYQPASSTAAIAHLEALRALGAEYLLIPSTGAWWLTHYVGFGSHLTRRYRLVHNDAHCQIYALQHEAAGEGLSVLEQLRAFAEPFAMQATSASLLDWETDLELADLLPDLGVFSPVTPDAPLPYAGRSIDIVVVRAPDAAQLADARRLAREAVIILPDADPNVDPHRDADGLVGELTVEVVGSGGVRLPKVSIVVAATSDATLTVACLTSLFETLPTEFAGEVVLVGDDDVAAGITSDLPDRWRESVVTVAGPVGLGHLAAFNAGARAVRHEIVVFAHGDAVFLPGWLWPLLAPLINQSNVGACAGMVLSLDGAVEDDGERLSDGLAPASRADYDPELPSNRHTRTVDQCSSVLLATRRSLVARAGGLQATSPVWPYRRERYSLDLAGFGYTTLYEPLATVVHLNACSEDHH